jgi:hypothetical protein
MFSPCISHLRAAGKSVRFASCVEESRFLALSQAQLSLHLDSTRLRGEALKLVQKRNKHIGSDEKAVEIDSRQGNVLANY